MSRPCIRVFYGGPMEREFVGAIFEWRGPAPHHFVAVSDEVADEIAEVAARVSYGWGVVPVRARIGDTEFTTSLFPRDGGYLVPIKQSVRTAEALQVGDVVSVRLSV